MYAPFSGGPAHHGAVVIPGFYKLMAKPIDGIWTLEFHKLYGLTLS